MDFISVPKNNVWKIVWDIRPSKRFRDQRSTTHFLDLRILRSYNLNRNLIAAKQESIEDFSIETKHIFWNSIFRKIGIAVIIFAIFATFFWINKFSIEYIESKKTELSSTAQTILIHSNEALKLMQDLKFIEANHEFRIALSELNQFENTARPLLFLAFLSAKILPENDYLKTALMLHEMRSAILAAADFNNIINQIITKAPAAIFEGDLKFPSFLSLASDKLELIKLAIERIEQNKNAFSEKFAGKWFEDFAENKIMLNEAVESIKIIEKIFSQKELTILLMFQNPAEIRATGGFLGSYGIIRIENGKIAEFIVDDIYNPDGQLEERVLPPRPLRRVTPNLGARDANWFFDFELSAKKTATFLQKSTKNSFDIVVALNPIVISDILQLVGPIDMPEYKKVINAENFWEEAQFQTRAGEDRKINQPKRFLTIFGPRLLDKLKTIDARDFPKLVDILSHNIKGKNIFLWAKDPVLQEFIEEKNWDGKIAEVSLEEDYLAIVLTNIGGAKADYMMRHHYHLETVIEPSGDIINNLQIFRVHEGNKAKYPWWNARNFTYIRVYVPKDSTFLSISGTNKEPPLLELESESDYSFDPDIMMSIESALHLEEENLDIFEESGRTVFGFWHIIDPGKTKSISIRWKLPYKAGFAPPHYSFLFQTQSGVKGTFQHTIELPRGSSILSVEPQVESLARESLGERFSWRTEEMKGDIRQAISYKLK